MDDRCGESVEVRVQEGRHQELPLARSTAYLGSWHVQLGTPLYVLKELGGWATLEMVNRYAHPAPEHLKAHAERVSLGSTSQLRHSDGEPKQAAAA